MKPHPLYRHGEVVHFDQEAGIRRVYYDIDDDNGVIVTERLNDQQLIDGNTAVRNATAGQRFGDIRQVASIPHDVFMKELAPAMRQYDENHIRRVLNDADNQAFRTFEGNV